MIKIIFKKKIQAKQLSRRSSRMSNTQSSSASGVSAVLEQLEQMIISDEWVGREDAVNGHAPLAKTKSRENQRLSDLGRSLVTSASLKSYIDLLSSHHRQSIAAWLYGNTSQALSNQFRFPEALLHCSDTESTLSNSIKNGIGHAVKLALKSTYGTDYITKGWRAFADKGAPVVYVSPALHMDVASYLAAECGIADVVQLPKLEGDLTEIEGRIDHHAFEKILDEDLAAGKQPLIVIGVVGSTILGQNDMISKILEIRRNKHPFWLHIVGQAIAALTIKEPNSVLVHVLSQVDSMTMPLALWLGIPAAPVITLHRPVETHKATYREKLDTLPWWVASSYLTNKRITDIIENAFMLSKVMLKGLAALPQIEVVGMENPTEFANGVYKNRYTAPTALIFKYRYETVKKAAQAHKELSQKPEGELSHEATAQAEKVLQDELEYGDSLNSWLGQGLLSECQHLGIHMMELGGNYGTGFRFCPLEHSANLNSSVDHVQSFIRQLTDILKIVDSTVVARQKFAEFKEEFPSLTIVPIQKWAGVGAVCYIPSIVKETNASDWNGTQKQQISHLNEELVKALRSDDVAFSLGDCSAYGVCCVKFGMLSDPVDLADLVKVVAEKGREIENSPQYLDALADLIRQGIEAANKDLQLENDKRLQEEGVIRQLPLMGSLVNWFSPIDKEHQNIRGRSFNLKTGEMQSTDVLYKHKKSESLEKTPMTPIETPQAPHGFKTKPDVVPEEEGEDAAAAGKGQAKRGSTSGAEDEKPPTVTQPIANGGFSPNATPAAAAAANGKQ
ncbi:hypothetical protein WR25_05993 isoform C [Diploscapter pachys]|uniref:Pyridoxal-dependent decarboxylase domain-containing protein 1 n=1 Tax=Diploscapter pachys TaxID=2018661 RepID=A0A2A2LR27_9BILA|nr:hypothetical protein WR25_05993 isoform C [Diploscapter pachys]